MALNIALGRESEIFFVPETTVGTLVEPDSTHLVRTITTPVATQERETFDDAQLRNTRSKLAPTEGRYLAGSWNFDTYLKPSGSLGVPPPERNLLKGLMGVETINGSTSCVYTSSTADLSSYSIWFKEKHTVFFCTGASVNQGVFKVSGREVAQASWSGQFIKKLWTGTSALGAAITDATSTSQSITVTAGQAAFFSVGSIIQIDSEIMKVTTVTVPSTLVVTRGYRSSTKATHLISVAISPWWQTGVETGNMVHGMLGTATMDATNYCTLTNEITISNGIKYYEEEKCSDSYFASEFGTPTMRELNARITVYFRKEEAKRFYDAYNWSSFALVVPAGSTSGKIVKFTLPQNKVKAPNITGDAERVVEMDVLPFSTAAYDDECSVTYI